MLIRDDGSRLVMNYYQSSRVHSGKPELCRARKILKIRNDCVKAVSVQNKVGVMNAEFKRSSFVWRTVEDFLDNVIQERCIVNPTHANIDVRE